MDRNTLIGLLLMFGIIAGSFYLMKPSEVEIKKEQVLQDSLARVKKGLAPLADSTKANTQLVAAQAAKPLDSAALKLPFGATKVGTEKIITVENDKIIAKISSKGGRVKSVQLKGQTNFNGKPLVLFEGDHNRFGLKFNVGGENINTNDLFFTSEDADVKVTGEDSKSIKLQLAYGADQYIEYVYTIKGNGYNLGLDINTKGIQNKIDQKTIALDWETILLQKEQNIDSERQKSTIYFKEAGNVDHLSEAKDEEKRA